MRGTTFVVKSVLSPRNLPPYPAFFLEPLAKAAAPRRVEHAGHGGNDPALLDERDLSFEDVGGIAVEPHDETRPDFQADLLDPFHAGEEIPVRGTAVQRGGITTPSLIVESGSIFNGSCTVKRETVAELPQHETGEEGTGPAD